jgi:nucleotide-binding universal stress UspA family protein
MYNTLLVPLDGSQRAEAILPHVEEMARRYHATIVFIQVVNADAVTNIGNSAEAEEKIVERTPPTPVEEAETYLSNIQKEFASKHIEAEVYIGEGPVVETIINIADRIGGDLIAMASHGRTGLGYVFYGSVAAGILNRIDRPLLIVRSV